MSTPRFHRLAVDELRRETADAVSLTFAIPKDLTEDFAFAPGQYLTLRTMMDGEEVRRSYSICSGPDDGELRIAVKKVDGGAFSSWAADELKSGDELDGMTPTGRFGVAAAPGDAACKVAPGLNGTPTFERFIRLPDWKVWVAFSPGLLPTSVSAFRSELRSDDIA